MNFRKIRLVSTLWILLTIIVAKRVSAQRDSLNYSLIPQPLSLQRSAGTFSLEGPIQVAAPKQWQPTAELLKASLGINGTQKTERQIVFIKVKKETLSLKLYKSDPHQLSDTSPFHVDEAYTLEVRPDKIIITAAATEGAIHGMFTLLQLQRLQWSPEKIPCATIVDAPRFAYRAMMLDVSRNFFPPAYIKKFIDLLALYKFNNFHWHLTDGAGWRIQIHQYPRLTTKAAWRPQGPQTDWSKAGRKYSQEGAPDAHGGYYTQAEAKQIVAYAARRGINIIPEIELPGHAEEALAAYPWLSATGKANNVSEYNVCNDSTFTFLENVLTEIMAIFPSTYIHIGGDEASKRSWKNCPACLALMKEKHLQTLEDVQSYAITRIEKFLHAHGRKLLGWDEITEGGLAPDAAVMVWRNPSTGYGVARQKHRVIMSPSKYLYFDHYQSNPMTEPEAIGGYIPLSKVYHYDLLPEDSLRPDQIPYLFGVQANLFTEYVPTMEHADYMLFPRTLAVAEIGWTQRAAQHYPDFLRRMQNQYLLLQRAGVNYCRPALNVLYDATVDTTRKALKICLSSERYQPEIHYTTNGTDPDVHSPVYTAPFYIQGHKTIKAAIFVSPALGAQLPSGKEPEKEPSEDKKSDSIFTFQADYHKGIGKKVLYQSRYAGSYKAAGERTLTDGITGTLTYSDDRWQGFLGKQFQVTVDMDSVQTLHSLDIRFMQLTGPGVYMPGYVEIAVSDDNKHFQPAGKVTTTVSPGERRLRLENYHFDLREQRGRYIRVTAPNTRHGFLFTDEIIIY